MATITVVNFGVPTELEIEAGATVEEVLAEAGIDADSTIRLRGETVTGEQRELIGVTGGDVLVAAPPQVDHGRA